MSTKKTIKNGKAVEETIEEYLLPNGEKEVTKTIKDGDKISSKKFHLNKGEDLPKELMN